MIIFNGFCNSIIRKFIFFMIFFLSNLIFSSEIHLSITVRNIKGGTGSIEVGIFNNRDYFLEEGFEAYTLSLPLEKSSDTITFSIIVKKGEYAVSLFHDVNGDGVCNLNFIGYPLEPFGFSNNVRPLISKPSYNNCIVNLLEDTNIEIKLID